MSMESRLRTLADSLNGEPRTLICDPEMMPVVRAAIDTLALGEQLTLRTSLVAPPGRLLVINEEMLRISLSEAFRNGPGIISNEPKES